jgi:hypothetical protein
VPAFTAGQVLTAAQMTQVNTGIPVFASSTERDAAFGGTGEKTLAEGQYAFLEDTNETQVYDGSTWAAVGAAGGKILQVVNAFHSTQVSVNSATYAATGLTATITPTAATSKVIVMITNPMRTWNNNITSTNSGQALSKLYRDGSEVHYFYEFGYLDNAATARDQRGNATITFIDSPATTSATTYEHYIASSNANYTVYSCYLNLTASIILMEVGA